MGSTNPFKEQSFSFTKRILPWILYALLPIALLPTALLCLHYYPLSFTAQSSQQSQQLHHSTTPIKTITFHSSFSASPSPIPSSPSLSNTTTMTTTSLSSKSSEKDEYYYEKQCDYSNGEWISDTIGPLYNATTCETVKESEKCIPNGRPDSEYLYWRWKPNQCNLPRFDPNSFLKLVTNKHIAFVGDSLARNQLESLLCMLSTFSTPNLVYTNGEDNKFRRWHFPSHNASFSLYWSPFLVKGVERSNTGQNYNTMYLDHVNERWGREIVNWDMVVVSFGHWFLLPSLYYEGGSVLGSLNCPQFNHTEIDFYDPLRKALRTTLNTIIERKKGNMGNGNNHDGFGVIVKTFSPAHFEGDWNKAGTCSKTRPFREDEKKLEGMDAEIRRIQLEEVEIAKEKGKEFGGLRFEALDVTKLVLLRPDGHPGPYMYPFPFAKGIPEYVQNDCVHWCLPGPIDTWNEILLEITKKWKEQSSRNQE